MWNSPNRVTAPVFAAVLGMNLWVSAGASELLVERVTVLSPEQAQPLTNRFVLIRDGRIASVSAREPALSQSAQRIDGRGKFLTPGLMDSHVHVSDTPGIGMSMDPTLAPLRAAYARQQPRSYLYFGVTQVLDPSNTQEAIDIFNAQPQRPDLFRCGPAPVLNGYPALFAPAPLRYQLMPNYIVEPGNRDALPDGADPSAHTPEAVVARIAASGAKCIKLFVEDGFGPASDWPILSVATIARVRQAAHERELLVMAHANALDTQRMAIAGRVDVIAHGLWNWTGVDQTDGVPAVIAEHLRNVHAHKIGWQPTIRVLLGTRELFLPNALDDPLYRKVVPLELLNWYRTDAGQWFKLQMRKDYGDAPDAAIAQAQWRTAELGMRATRHLFELGHPLLLASDTPSAPTYGNQPGYDTFREMQSLAQAGIPLRAIFAAATINNARQFRIDGDYGTVQPGKIANLLLLSANPLESVNAWNRIDQVILHGTLIDRETLAADFVASSRK